jgi:hypothetical protein
MSEPGTGMSSFVKAAIVVMAGIAFLGTLLLILGWFWWKNNQKEIMQTSSSARDEGKRIGKDLTEQECLNTSIARTSGETGFTDMISNGVFLGACLESSKPVEEFCKDTPKETEFARSIQWRRARCKEIKLEQNQCSALLGVVQRYCHEDRKRSGKG